ncbi:unnamed protein product, partial [Closterium sp. NIES-53]
MATQLVESRHGDSQPSPVADLPPILRFAPSSQPWTTEEDAVLLRHALRHGTRQWGQLVRGKQLARGNKACCNRFLFLKNFAVRFRTVSFAAHTQLTHVSLSFPHTPRVFRKFTQKHADVTLPVQQQSQQGQAVSPSAGQPQRNMWSRPDMALQYGGLSLVKCMQLFLPPGLLHTPTPSDVSPEQTPEFNPPPAAVTTAAGRGHAVAAAAGVAATAPQQSTTAASLTAHQLARILFPNSHATDSHPMDRGLKRLRNDDTGVSTGAAHTAGMREGLSARQREDIEAIDASAVRSLLLRPADSQSHHHQCDSSASPSNAASSASVDCSPPSSQTSSQPSFQHVFQCTAGAVESQQLQAMRPHKMPRTSHGVLPLAALEFARSFFSGLPGRDDHQGGESSDGQKTLEPACTSARQDSRLSGGNAETQYGCVGGGAATELPPKACQPSLPEIVSAAAAAPGVSAATAVTGTPDVDSPAAAALAAAAEGIRQGDVSIWKDFIELEGEAEEVVCSVEKRTGLTVGTFCELEELFEETVLELSNAAK